MKDIILNSYLQDFSEKFNFSEIEQDKLFEHFVNYNMVSKLYPNEIDDIESLSVGDGGDTGIDGLAIIVNGNIVTSKEEVADLIQINKGIEVQFVFIQAKNSPKFESSQVATFTYGVKHFFRDKATIAENERVEQLRVVKDFIYEKASSFNRGKLPEIRMYYVSTGEWKSPEDIINRNIDELSELHNKNIFGNIPQVEFIDRENIKNIWQELSRSIEKEIVFTNKINLPDLPKDLNVVQSFIGSLEAKEYIKLISNSNGDILKELFYDNVRDYQGMNKINKEIAETLNDNSKKFLMPLLNNGITIIAKQINPIGNKITLSDFQIVNGCQSSHILHSLKDIDLEGVSIVVKIIQTTNQDIINSIIIATNKQTEVKDEAFESIKPFHGKLNSYFLAKSQNCSNKLYYERRSKEYSNNPAIKPYQIVTLSYLTKAYISSVLEQPQSTHRYFGELISSNDDKIFKSEKNIDDYYLSAFILKKIDSLFNRKKLLNKYKIYKFHILFLIFIRIKKSKNKIDIDTLDFFDYAKQACQIIALVNQKNGNYQSHHKNIRDKNFTFQIKEREKIFQYS